MANVTKAFEVDNGIVINDGAAVLSGSGSPVGTEAPKGSLFLSTEDVIWKKFGTGNNDWRAYAAEDIVFDPSTSDLTAIEVQTALEQLAGRNFGKDFSVAEKEASESTTGNSFDTYSSLTFNVSEASNKFRLNSDFYWGHNAASNDIRVRVQLDGTTLGSEIRIEPKDTGTDQRIQNNILRYVDNLSVGSHTLDLQYKPSSNSKVSRMYSSTIESWRVE